METDYSQYVMQWGDKKVLFIMAANEEYGEHLRATGMNPLISGIGATNAAMQLTRALTMLEQSGNMPDLVINMGTAGVQDLPVNTVYEVSAIRNLDVDCSALALAPGEMPGSPYPAVIDIPSRLGLPQAECGTTQRYNTLIPEKGAPDELEEMEFAAVVDVCNYFGIPAIGLKGVSNNAEVIHDSEQSWADYCRIVDVEFARILEGVKANVESGKIPDEVLLAMPPAWYAVNGAPKQKNDIMTWDVGATVPNLKVVSGAREAALA